jgi:SNF2 family DNA or RNA helicase
LSNFVGGLTKFIRIDGSTSPKSRQEQILTFQTDPTVRIALLGITAAGVAVTLTASSTVWFAELFWTPAIMVQAEDRCHRIGQQATVRCLYFIAKGTLDEVLWKLIEKKFRDLGEVSSYAFLLSSAEQTANYSSFALNLVRRGKGKHGYSSRTRARG